MASGMQDKERSWYVVELRSHAAPVTGNLGITIGRLPVHTVEFEVVLDEEDIPERASLDDQIDAQRYQAAQYAAGNIAAWTDWPAGEYIVTVRGRDSATVYDAAIDEHRSYTLRKRGE